MENVAARTFEKTRGSLTLSPTARVAKWSARHRWWVVLASVLTIVVAMFVSSTVETRLLDGDAGGVGESQTAEVLLDQRFEADRVLQEDAEASGRIELLVITHPSLTVEDPEFRSKVDELTRELRALPK